MESQTNSRKCGKCVFCVKDDGHPYCLMKDLYTNVCLDDDCDEINILGEYYFSERKELDFDEEGDEDYPEGDYE